MQRDTYLSTPMVTDFISWLARELDSDTLFQHRYVDRRSGAPWQCASLFNAYEGYAWNHPGNRRLGVQGGVCAHSNGVALAALRQDLQAAAQDDELCLQAAVDVMAWGGVKAGNVAWLTDHRQGLARLIQEVQTAIEAGDARAPVLRAPGLRFNSGMTKVYSLRCREFVIYDSRVAAALGWLVVIFCRLHGLAQVPAALCFPWAAAKEAQTMRAPKRRNPGEGGLKFPRLRSGPAHALWNMRASWLLGAVLRHPAAAQCRFNTQVAAPNDPLRALEAALFMIGYDLG